jgi:hypothetical protein
MANTIAKSLRFELKVYGLTVQLSVFFYFFIFFAKGKQCAGFFQGIIDSPEKAKKKTFLIFDPDFFGQGFRVAFRTKITTYRRKNWCHVRYSTPFLRSRS